MIRERDARFDQFYSENYGRMVKVAYRATGDMGLAEDLTQDAFVLAVADQDRLWTHPNPVGWLMKALRFMILNDRRRMYHTELPLNEEACRLASWEENKLWEIMPRTLTQEEQKLFTMCYEERASNREIADRLGISQAACRTRMKRLREKLAKLLDDI